MLQGVYVFLIFVCKRNVYEVIFKRKYANLEEEKGKGVELSRQTKEKGYASKFYLYQSKYELVKTTFVLSIVTYS